MHVSLEKSLINVFLHFLHKFSVVSHINLCDILIFTWSSRYSGNENVAGKFICMVQSSSLSDAPKFIPHKSLCCLAKTTKDFFFTVVNLFLVWIRTSDKAGALYISENFHNSLHKNGRIYLRLVSVHCNMTSSRN